MAKELCNPEAEQAVVGACLSRGEKAIRRAIAAGCCSGWFYSSQAGAVWDVIHDRYNRGEFVDSVTVMSELDPELVTQNDLNVYTNACRTATHTEEYLIILRNSYCKRRASEVMLSSLDQLSGSKNAEELISATRFSLDKIAKESGSVQQETPADTLSTLVGGFRAGSTIGNVGIPSRWKCLQDVTGGYRKGKVCIVGARPKMGKSIFGANEAIFSAQDNIPAAIFSLEMTKKEMMTRIICDIGNMDAFKFEMGRASSAEVDKFERIGSDILQLPLYLYDRPMSIEQLCSCMRDAKSEHDIQMAVIDYLQLLRPSLYGSHKNRNTEVAAQSNSIVNVTKEIDTATILISQLSRSATQEDKPQLHHLRDSGSLEQDAYQVIFIRRDRKTDPFDEKLPSIFDVAAHRGGPEDEVRVDFVPNREKFVDPNVKPEPF